MEEGKSRKVIRREEREKRKDLKKVCGMSDPLALSVQYAKNKEKGGMG